MFKRLAQFILADAFHWLSDVRLFEELRQKHWGGDRWCCSVVLASQADLAVKFLAISHLQSNDRVAFIAPAPEAIGLVFDTMYWNWNLKWYYTSNHRTFLISIIDDTLQGTN